MARHHQELIPYPQDLERIIFSRWGYTSDAEFIKALGYTSGWLPRARQKGITQSCLKAMQMLSELGDFLERSECKPKAVITPKQLKRLLHLAIDANDTDLIIVLAKILAED